jgi:hypothetical protein
LLGGYFDFSGLFVFQRVIIMLRHAPVAARFVCNAV